MSEEEFAVLLAEFRELRRTISAAVAQIAHHEEELEALHLLLKHKPFATAEEFDAANLEARRTLRASLFHHDEGEAVGNRPVMLTRELDATQKTKSTLPPKNLIGIRRQSRLTRIY